MQLTLLGRYFQKDIDNAVTARIKEFEKQPFIEDENFALGGECTEVAGYIFLNLWLLGPLNIHTFDGCKIKFVATDAEMEVESDSTEITTLYSNRMGIGISEFSLELEENLKEFILHKTVVGIEILADKKKAAITIKDVTEFRKLISTNF